MADIKYRNRNHVLMLYPEDTTHVEAMSKIMEDGYDYLAILHDKDKWTAEDEKANPEHKEGAYKKEHWHVVLTFKQAKWNTALAKELGIETNYVRECKNIDNAILYLMHYNDNDKAQYTEEEVFGTRKQKLHELLNKNDETEGERIIKMIEMLEECGYMTVTDFAKWCAKEGYWAEFRRSGTIFCKILEEHNSKYKNNN